MGSRQTPFLAQLNQREGLVSVRTPVIRNADQSFVYFALQDGVLAPGPTIATFANPTDFSGSARLKGAREITLTGQGACDPSLLGSHLGSLNSSATWTATLEFLTQRAAQP